MLWITLAAALAFATVHVFAGRLLFLRRAPRSRWLSAAGGVSVAYVFVHLLPELGEHQAALAESGGLARAVPFVENHVYLVALGGLTAFYGLERLAASSGSHDSGHPVRPSEQAGVVDRAEADPAGAPGRHPSPGVFWVHIGAFALYNGLIGYLLLHREDADRLSLATYAAALGVHFVVNDVGLRRHHREAYHAVGRWVLAAAPLVGWAVGAIGGDPDPRALAVLFALVAGAVVLNVLKEELPEDRQSRFWAFLAGAGGYAALLLAAA